MKTYTQKELDAEVERVREEERIKALEWVRGKFQRYGHYSIDIVERELRALKNIITPSYNTN